ILRLGVVRVDIVQVVRRQQRRARLATEVVEQRVERALGRLRSVVILHLNVEVLRPEDVLIPARRRPRAVQVATQQQLGYLAGKAAGGDDQSLGVPLQNLLVDTRTIVIATGVGDGRQLEQVVVARAILRQQQQVIVVVAT